MRLKMKPNLAEFIGTFAIVFAGTGAIIINDVSGGSITHVGVALTFGLVVLAMIYAVGDISGAHLNPAVTSGFWLPGRFPGRQAFYSFLPNALAPLGPAERCTFFSRCTPHAAPLCHPVQRCSFLFWSSF